MSTGVKHEIQGLEDSDISKHTYNSETNLIYLHEM